jgi:CRP-like cAMP-binding protein
MTAHLHSHHRSLAPLRDFASKLFTAHGALTPAEEIQVNTSLAAMETVTAGTELFVEGQLLNCPLLLLEGWAVRQRVLSDGRRQIVSFILPGDVMGLCERTDAVALCSTVAVTDVTFASMPVLADALRAKSGALYRWSREAIATQERGLYDQVVRLGRQSAYERLVHQLLDFYYRLRGVDLLEGHSFALPFTQEVLSDALGLSTVHTNRTLQQLRREHLIESHGQIIHLINLPRLAEICDYQPPRQVRKPLAL